MGSAGRDGGIVGWPGEVVEMVDDGNDAGCGLPGDVRGEEEGGGGGLRWEHLRLVDTTCRRGGYLRPHLHRYCLASSSQVVEWA